MEKIDDRDKRILYELDLNARQSNNSIGKKINLSENAVKYRIKKLEDAKVIKNYYIHIDAFKLGCMNLRYYLKLQYKTSKIVNEIIKHFVDCNLINIVYSLFGKHDILLFFVFNDSTKFNSFWQKTFDKYSNYIETQTLTYYLKFQCFKPTYLIFNRGDDRTLFDFFDQKIRVHIDETDEKIMKILNENSRESITNIAKKINISASTIKYRINNLIKSGLIKGFRTNFDITRLGYNYYKVEIFLKEYKYRYEIINAIKKSPYLISINTTTGLSHFEFEFILKDLYQLQHIMNGISNKYPNIIRKYEYIIIKDIHKNQYMPDLS